MALFEVIRKKKENDNIIYKYPKTNFNTGSQLIVEESQEALFFSSGKALDLFPAGKYTLSTNNIPLLRNFINIPTGFRTPFTCQVYFIDLTEKYSKWGTPSKIEFLEPIYNFPIQIGCCGEFRFKVIDSRKLILKLVGIKDSFTSENIDDFFSSQMLMRIKTYIANIIKENKISIFEIDGKLEQLSKELQDKLQNDFVEYGIELKNFFVTTIQKPEDDKQYLMFKELYFKNGVGIATATVDKQLDLIKASKEAEEKIMKSEAEAIKRKQEGYSYREEKQFEIGKEMAKNEAVGEFTNMGVGLGLISGVSAPLGESVSQTVSGAFTSNQKICTKCKTVNSVDARFCKNCGNMLAKKICKNCGKELENDATFCSNCGNKVN